MLRHWGQMDSGGPGGLIKVDRPARRVLGSWKATPGQAELGWRFTIGCRPYLAPWWLLRGVRPCCSCHLPASSLILSPGQQVRCHTDVTLEDGNAA